MTHSPSVPASVDEPTVVVDEPKGILVGRILPLEEALALPEAADVRAALLEFLALPDAGLLRMRVRKLADELLRRDTGIARLNYGEDHSDPIHALPSGDFQ